MAAIFDLRLTLTPHITIISLVECSCVSGLVPRISLFLAFSCDFLFSKRFYSRQLKSYLDALGCPWMHTVQLNPQNILTHSKDNHSKVYYTQCFTQNIIVQKTNCHSPRRSSETTMCCLYTLECSHHEDLRLISVYSWQRTTYIIDNGFLPLLVCFA